MTIFKPYHILHFAIFLDISMSYLSTFKVVKSLISLSARHDRWNAFSIIFNMCKNWLNDESINMNILMQEYLLNLKTIKSIGVQQIQQINWRRKSHMNIFIFIKVGFKTSKGGFMQIFSVTEKKGVRMPAGRPIYWW